MIKLVVFAVAAICLVGSTTAEVNVTPDCDYQKCVDQLLDFWPAIQKKVLDEEKKFNYEEALKVWNNTEALTEFMHRHLDRKLERDAIFDFNNPLYIEEVILFYKALSSAPTDDWFFTFAAWAHVHLNKGIFANTFIRATAYRESTSNITFPAPYQIFRNYYYPSATLKVFSDKIFNILSGNIAESKYNESIWANFSSPYAKFNREFKLDYIYNDKDLTGNHYRLSIMNPPWINSKIGSLTWVSYITYYINRLGLEYLSHGMDPKREFSWRYPEIPPYMPSMIYENGVTFVQRDELPYKSSRFMQLIDEIITLEQIIKETIAVGHVITAEGKQSIIDLDALDKLLQGDANSVNVKLYKSYKRLAEKILGYSDRRSQYWEQYPNSLENPSTALRDPAFYMLYLRIVGFFNRLKEQLKPHSQNELAYSDVVITKFKVDKVITYIKPYDTLLANISVHDESYPIEARQLRLGHHALHFHFNIKSIKIARLVVRVFAGPPKKYHGMSDFEYYSQFYLVYCNERDVVVGNNDLVLSSEDNLVGSFDFDNHPWSGDDFESGRLLVFPKRMIFPRGNCEGMPVKYMAYISEYDSETKEQRCDKKSLEFPFDRRIENMTMPNLAEYYGKIIFNNDYVATHAVE